MTKYLKAVGFDMEKRRITGKNLRIFMSVRGNRQARINCLHMWLEAQGYGPEIEEAAPEPEPEPEAVEQPPANPPE